MKRRFFTILSALSLLVCMATVVLWWRSYRPNPTEIQLVRERRYSIISSRGMVFVERWTASRWKSKDAFALGGVPDAITAWEVPAGISDNDRWQFHIGSAAAGFECPEFCGFGSSADGYFTTVFNGHERVYGMIRQRVVAFPYWFIVVVLLVLPILELRRRERIRLRSRANRCVACGYDLRASPGRCPECGTLPLARR